DALEADVRSRGELRTAGRRPAAVPRATRCTGNNSNREWSASTTVQPLASARLLPSVEVVASTSLRLERDGRARPSAPRASTCPGPDPLTAAEAAEVVIAVGPLVGGRG